MIDKGLFCLSFFSLRSFCRRSGSRSRCSLRSYGLSGNHVDDVSRTSLCTQTTVLTLISINYSMVVFNLDRFKLTCLFAQLTTDTTSVTNLTGDLTVVGGRTANPYAALLRNQLDQSLRTSLCTSTASNALFHIDPSYTVDNLDRVILTCGDAVTETDTAVLTFAGATEEALSSSTSGEALVFHALLVNTFSAGAVYTSNLRFAVTSIYAQNCSDTSSSSSTAGSTQVRSNGGICSQSCSIVVTTSEAATTAVSAGQAFSDLYSSFINGNSHELSS